MLELYHCPGTRSLRSLWLLHELDVDFRLFEMPFDLAVLRSPAYLAIHPLGRVPCLVRGDFKLFESGAIAEYLCETYPRRGMGRPQGDPERYEWLQWIHFSETIATHIGALVQQVRFIPREDRSDAVWALEARRLEKCLDVIDSHLAGREYLLSSGFSAADIGVGCSLHFAAELLELGGWPRLARYHANACGRTAFLAAIAGAAATS